MKTQQIKRLDRMLLQNTATSRYNIIKEIWDMNKISRKDFRKRLTTMLSILRNEVFEIITSREIASTHPLIREIAEYDGWPTVKKNIVILAICGIDPECISAINCINTGYVRICLMGLKAEYPEIFR